MEFDCALTKVSKLCYKTANNAACSRLLNDIRSTLSFAENLDGIRSQLISAPVLSKLTTYSDALYQVRYFLTVWRSLLSQTFEIYTKSRHIEEPDTSERLLLSTEGCVDYFTGYFICPEFITPDHVLEVYRSTYPHRHTVNIFDRLRRR